MLWPCCRNIVACYGIGKYDDDDEHNPGSLFIVQELVRGGNLLHKVYKQMLNRQKCVYTSQEALNWLMDVAEGMLYLHTITDNKPMIIHRDLKVCRGVFRMQASLMMLRAHICIEDQWSCGACCIADSCINAMPTHCKVFGGTSASGVCG